VIDVSAYVKPLRDGITATNFLSFNLKFDGAVVKSFSASNANKGNYMPMTGTVTVVGAGPHTISLDVSTKGKSGNIFAVDDFSVKAVVPQPTTGTKFCSN
jgi:hypothetical protein